jgi:prepilin-type N-terminal cleavage/methylation domain-containing protein
MVRTRNAFSLLELLMAVSLLAIIAIAVTSVSMALSGGMEHNRDYYHCLQSTRVGLLRIEDMVRHAALIADADDDILWVWCEDSNQDGKMNLSETALIRWESATRQLVEYRSEVPGGSGKGKKGKSSDKEIKSWLYGHADWVYQFYFANSSSTVRTVLADDVTHFRVESTPNAPYGEFVTLSMTVAKGDRDMTLRSAVKLRDNWGEYIQWSDDRWSVVRYEEP